MIRQVQSQSFFKKYRLIRQTNQLKIVKNPFFHVLAFCFFLVLFLFFTAIISVNVLNSYINDRFNAYALLFYLAPVFLIRPMIHYFKNIIRPDTFIFDKKGNQYLINGLPKLNLKSIRKVQIDYPYHYDMSTCVLKLLLSDHQKHLVVDKYDAGNNREIIDIAKAISRFLDVPLEDTHPYEEKL